MLPLGRGKDVRQENGIAAHNLACRRGDEMFEWGKMFGKGQRALEGVVRREERGRWKKTFG